MHEMSTDELDELAKEVAGKGGKWRFDKEHRLLFIDKIVGGAIPKEFIPPIEDGVREAMETGVLAGYEMVDLAVVVIDGSYHDVDSSEMAFKIAGSMAFKEACRKAQSEAARADHEGGSGGAGRLHGPGDRGPELAARPDAGPGIARRHAKSSTCRCRWRRCSVMPPIFAAARRAAAALPCTSRITSRRRPNVAEEVIGASDGQSGEVIVRFGRRDSYSTLKRRSGERHGEGKIRAESSRT